MASVSPQHQLLPQMLGSFIAGYFERVVELADGESEQQLEKRPDEADDVAALRLQAQALLRGGHPFSTTADDSGSSGCPPVVTTFLRFYFAQEESERRQLLQQLRRQAGTATDALSLRLLCVALVHSDPLAAAELCSSGRETLLRAALCLLLHRPDLATEAAAQLNSEDDEAVPAKWAHAMVCAATGGEHEATLALNEVHAQCLRDAYGKESARVVAMKAAANLLRGMHEQALEDLTGVAGATADAASTADTLANTACAYAWAVNDEKMRDTLSKLEQLQPKHPLAVEMHRINDAFTKFAAQA